MTSAPPQPPDDLALASIFEPATREQWLEQVAVALRKSRRLKDDAPAAEAEAQLLTALYDGFEVKPLYTQDDALPPERTGVPGAAPFVRGGTAAGAVASGWDVRAHHANPDPKVTHEAVMTDLENGVSSLWIALGPHALPVEALGAVLQDVFLDLAPVALDAGPLTGAAAQALFATVEDRGIDPAQVGGTLGADPIGARARYGRTATPDTAELVALAGRCTEFPLLRPGLVDATPYHDAGGSDAEELGASIATGLAYLRALTDAGLGIDDAFGRLEFRYAVNADQFSSIAKLRAARRLWARIGEVCGASATAQKQHAVTSTAMMSRRDPWVNMLRTTLAGFGAGVGGADAVTVQPFDAALGLPDDLSRRIARNTSALLMLESHVARVIDPAGGSWYVEQLTDQLAGTAWDWFTEIERAGGIVAALDAGLVEQRLAATWDRRAKNLAHRRDALTGVSEFPNLTEKPVVRPVAPPQQHRGEGALPVHRYASEYEALRDAADHHADLTGERAAVFLATLGPAAAFTARSTFAANLFQAGGLATPDSGPTTDPEVIAAAFGESRATVACIASSDKVYAAHAADVAAALRTAGAQRVWLAGKPGENADEWAAAGIDGYVFTGCDALAVLRSAHDDSGVTDAIEEAAE